MATSKIDRRTRRSRFRTGLPARSQFLLFPELWDMEENEVGYAIWVDHDWNVFGVGTVTPSKEFDYERGSWFKNWMCWTFDPLPERWRRLMVHVLLFQSDRVVTLPARPRVSIIDGGLEPLFVYIPEPGAESVLPDPPEMFEYHRYPLGITVTILMDEPTMEMPRDLNISVNPLPAGVYRTRDDYYILWPDPYYQQGVDKVAAILLEHMEEADP
jgi:hypothetical protein